MARDDVREKFLVCGIDELPSHSERPITHVLSLLDPGREEPEAFASFGAHRRLTLRFHDMLEPWPGYVAPESEHVAALLDFGRGIDLGPEAADHILVHCHVGVSRSTAAMATLLAASDPAAEEGAIFARLLRARPQAWPNSRMIAFADDLLGRDGRFVAALRRLYGHQIATRPQLAEAIRSYGRQREIDMALP